MEAEPPAEPEALQVALRLTSLVAEAASAGLQGNSEPAAAELAVSGPLLVPGTASSAVESLEPAAAAAAASGPLSADERVAFEERLRVEGRAREVRGAVSSCAQPSAYRWLRAAVGKKMIYITSPSAVKAE
jgi:hypothetical protein